MVFVTYSSTAYWTLQVSSGFVDGEALHFAYDPYPLAYKSQPAFTAEVQRMRTLLENNALERLGPISCIDAYNIKYQSTYGSVLLVSDNATAVVHNTCHQPCLDDNTCPFADHCRPTFNSGWMCNSVYGFVPQAVASGRCTLLTQELRNNASDWKPSIDGLDGTLKTAYCLAERKEGRCSVHSSPHVAMIVLALNSTKAIAMLAVSRMISGRSLVTIGDAICSFLKTPDRYTKGLCLASRRDFKRMRGDWQSSPKTFARNRVRYFTTAGKTRWLGCIALYVFSILWFVPVTSS